METVSKAKPENVSSFPAGKNTPKTRRSVGRSVGRSSMAGSNDRDWANTGCKRKEGKTNKRNRTAGLGSRKKGVFFLFLKDKGENRRDRSRGSEKEREIREKIFE